MIGNTFQPRPIDVLDIHVVHAAHFVAHDSPRGVHVLQSIGQRAEGVAQGVEGHAGVSLNVQAIAQGCKFFGHFVDVARLKILHPFVAARMPEDKLIVGALGHDIAQSIDGLRPQGNVANHHPLSTDCLDSLPLQVNIFAAEYRAVGCAKSSIDAEQYHCLELSGCRVDELLNVGGLNHPVLSGSAQLGNAHLLEPLPEPHRAFNPAAFVGVVEHGDDAGTLAVEGVAADLPEQVSPIAGEVVGPQVTDQAVAAELLEEATKRPANIGQMPRGDFSGIMPRLLLVCEQVCELLEGDGLCIRRDTRAPTSVQVMLDPIIFGAGVCAVAVATEIVQVSVDSLLEPSVRAWFGWESFDWFCLVTTGHADTLASVRLICKCSQIDSQAKDAILAHMDETTEKPIAGSVAQRLEQGTHNPIAENRLSENPKESAETPPAKAAQSPNKRSKSSRLNTGETTAQESAAGHYNRQVELRDPSRETYRTWLNNIHSIERSLQSCGIKTPAVYRYPVEGTIYGHVYLLLKKSKVVYVGQTVNLATRITVHRNKFGRRFDEVYHIYVKRDWLTAVEARLIKLLQPALNLRCTERDAARMRGRFTSKCTSPRLAGRGEDR